MTKSNEPNKFRDISSFDDLRKRKREIDDEIKEKASSVSRSTEHLLEEGMKVVAVGFLAFLVSRLLNVFMSSGSSRNTKSSGEGEKAFASASSQGGQESEDRDAPGSANAHRSEESAEYTNGQQSHLDTALVWLETVSGGLEAAKIILNQIAEVQEQAKHKSSTERSTEEETTG